MQAVPGVSQLPQDYNPATWMLEVSGGGAKMHTDAVDVNFADVYRRSERCKETAATADALAEAAKARGAPLALASRYAASLPQQILHVTRKLFIVYWCACT